MNAEVVKTDLVRVHGKSCMGCVNNKADIMLTVSGITGSGWAVQGRGILFDIFLSDEQAKTLMEELSQRLKQNKREA